MHDFYVALRTALAAIFSGWVLYRSFTPGGSLMIPLAVIAALMLPFVFLWKTLSKKILFTVLLLTLPFNIDQTLFLREHNGGAAGFIISLSGLTVLILYLIYFLEAYQRQTPAFGFFRPIVYVLLGLGAMTLISLAKAPNRELGLFEWLELVKMLAIFLYVKYAVRSHVSLRMILHVILIGLILEGVIGIAQFVTGSTLNLTILGGHPNEVMHQAVDGGLSRVGGTLGGPNAFAWYLDFLLPIPLAVILLGRGKRSLFLNTAALLFGCTALFMTLSRGGWVGMLVSGLIVLAYLVTRLNPVKRFYTILIMILIACIAVILIFSIANPVRDRFMTEDEGSAYVRIPLMRVALKIIQHHPFIGVGLNNYTLMDQFYDHTPGMVSTYFPYPVHNVFLQLAAEAGLIALICFLAFIGTVFLKAARLFHADDPLISAFAVGAFAGLAGGLIQGLVENATIGSAHLLPIWILSGVIAGVAEKVGRTLGGVPEGKSE